MSTNKDRYSKDQPTTMYYLLDSLGTRLNFTVMRYGSTSEIVKTANQTELISLFSCADWLDCLTTLDQIEYRLIRDNDTTL